MASESPPSFIHLRSHSAYSLAEGALHIKQMAGLAKDLGMPALAIADSGNLFGALEFSGALAEKGIRPIIGCTLNVDLADASAEGTGRHNGAARKLPSLVLPAKDEAG